MATTDNKVLSGAGVEQLSQLVKNAIAQGGAVSGMTGMELLQFLAGGADMTIFANQLVADLPHPASDADIVAQLKARGWCVTGTGASAKASDILTALEDNTTKVYYAGAVQSYGVQWYSSNASSMIILPNSYVFYQSAASPAHLYIIPSDLFAQAFGNYIGFKSLSGLTSTTLAKGIDEVNNKIPTIATTETPGTVIPDGTSITIDSNGVISSQGGGSSLPSDPVVDGSYKLVNTVATVEGTQTATQSWQEDTGYTAGSGIEIDNGVISKKYKPLGFSVVNLLAPYVSSPRPALNDYECYQTGDTTEALRYLENGVAFLWTGNTTTSQTSPRLATCTPASYIIIKTYTATTATVAQTSYFHLQKNYVHFFDGNVLIRFEATKTGGETWVNDGVFSNMVRNLVLTPAGSSAAYTLGQALDDRPPAALVSTDTAPSVEGAINWVYK